MSKKQKTALAVIGVLIVAVWIFILILGRYKIEIPEAIEYPPGDLSDSIFDSQNSEYVPQDAFSLVHTFVNIPYTIDTVAEDCASIDTGSVYDEGEYYFYYAEIRKDEKTSDCIKRQFSQVLEYGSDPAECAIDTIVSETGFINGFSAEYQVSHLSVPVKWGAETEKNAYMVSYRLTTNDDFPAEYDILIGVATRTLSTESLGYCKGLLDLNVYTIQYDKELAQELLKNMENATGEEATEMIEEATEIVGEEGGVLRNEEVDKTAKTMGITVNQDYKDLSVIVDWTNLEAAPTIVFSDIREETVFEPSEESEGRVVFHVGEVEAGVYMVKIRGWEEAGTFTSELVENSQEEEINVTTETEE